MADLRAEFYRELSARVSGKLKAFDWTPTPRQMLAIGSKADELLFGGAARGGKSACILGLGRMNHTRALAVRRNFSSLKKTLIEKSIEMFGHANRFYNRSDGVWRWPDGHVFQFAHFQYEDSLGNYLSTEYDLLAYDELTQFTLNQYISLRRSLSTTIPWQRTRSIGATNPGGLGNDWVMERWAPWLDEAHARPAKPGELRWYCRINDKDTAVPGPWPVKYKGEDLIPLSRTFIPAKVSDNPHVNKAIIAQLQSLPEPFRSQQLHGDWKAGLIEDANQTIPRRWLRAAMNRWRKRHGDLGPGVVGTDVAAGGSDHTVLAPLYGSYWDELVKKPGAATALGDDVLAMLLPFLLKGCTAHVDAIGIGLATIQAAKTAGLLNAVVPIGFGQGTVERDISRTIGFGNVRALGFWRLREMLDPTRKLAPGEEPPEIPPDPELFTDLTAPKFEQRGGRIFIEKKEDIKKRIGRSPDAGDAVVLTLAAPRRFDMERYAARVTESHRDD